MMDIFTTCRSLKVSASLKKFKTSRLSGIYGVIGGAVFYSQPHSSQVNIFHHDLLQIFRTAGRGL